MGNNSSYKIIQLDANIRFALFLFCIFYLLVVLFQGKTLDFVLNNLNYQKTDLNKDWHENLVYQEEIETVDSFIIHEKVHKPNHKTNRLFFTNDQPIRSIFLDIVIPPPRHLNFA